MNFVESIGETMLKERKFYTGLAVASLIYGIGTLAGPLGGGCKNK